MNDNKDIIGFNQKNRDYWVKKAAQSISAGSVVLDAGAGECRYRDLFAHCVYQTQDFANYKGTPAGVLKEDWKYGKLDYECDITAIPVADNSFDAILCTEVLEHVPEPIKAIQEFARILKPKGRLFLTAPLGCGIHQDPYHYYGGYTPYFFQKFLPEVGFAIEEIKANGGFFRHFLQESSRAGNIILSRKKYSRLNPFKYFISWLFLKFIPRFCNKLDDEIFITEFTVGFFVKAQKL